MGAFSCRRPKENAAVLSVTAGARARAAPVELFVCSVYTYSETFRVSDERKRARAIFGAGGITSKTHDRADDVASG